MPQAKKAQFQVIGKYVDRAGKVVRPGTIITVEVDGDSKPLDSLIAARVRPFKGEVVGVEASDVIDQANAEAARIIEAAKAEAAQVVEAAGMEAARIIEEATKAGKK